MNESSEVVRPLVVLFDSDRARCEALAPILREANAVVVASDADVALAEAAAADVVVLGCGGAHLDLAIVAEHLGREAPYARGIIVVGDGAEGPAFTVAVSAFPRIRWPAAPSEVRPLVALAAEASRRSRSEEKILRDLRASIDDLRESERDRIQSEKLAALGRMSAGLAHEINNPLQSVIGFATLVRESLEAGDTRDDLDLVLVNAARIQKAVRALSVFGRRARGVRIRTAINPIVKAAVDDVHRERGGGSVRVDLDLASGLPDVETQVANLTQAVAAVISNAFQAVASDKAVVRVITRRGADDTVVCEVSDNGPGIAPEDLPLVFEPFFTTTPPGRGQGLGLSIAYGVVKDDGGDITVESAPGQGTIVRIALPVVQPPPDPDRLPLPDGEALRVLVVDDEPAIRDILARVLSGSAVHNLSVRQAGDGATALSLLDEEPADVVFADIHMPGMDGLEFVEKAKRRRPQTRAVVITGHTDLYRAKDALARGADEYITKPFHFNEVLMVLDKMVARRSTAAGAATPG